MRTMHLIDDGEGVLRSARFMLRGAGFAVVSHATAAAFLSAAHAAATGCVLFDIRMPGIDGLDVQQTMNERGIAWPVIMLTGHGDMVRAVRAMKAGAVDVLAKPLERAVLLAAIELGFDRLDDADRCRIGAAEAVVHLAALTGRERDVLDGLVRGDANKAIAADLGISPRTVEVYRANLMIKLCVGNLSALLRIAFAAGLGLETGNRPYAMRTQANGGAPDRPIVRPCRQPGSQVRKRSGRGSANRRGSPPRDEVRAHEPA